VRDYDFRDFEHGRTPGKRYRFHPDCEDCQYEAWERMTYGGVQTGGTSKSFPTLLYTYTNGHVHQEILAYAAR
jgi:hypothetical protein